MAANVASASGPVNKSTRGGRYNRAVRLAGIACAVAAVLSLAVPARAAEGRCGTGPRLSRDLLALHGFRPSGDRAFATATEPERDRDVDDVAILEDRGDLLVRRNPVDLSGTAVRLTPYGASGFESTPLRLGLETGATVLPLAGEDAVGVELPFSFPFFGSRYSRLLVHPDGRVAFAGPGVAPVDRGLGSLLAGPPSIAAFLADLAPEASGRVGVSVTSERAVVSWTDVPETGTSRRNSFSVAVHAGGAIDLVYGRLEATEAIVGVAPGERTAFNSVDFSEGPLRVVDGALVERFSDRDHLDLVATARRFLRGHADAFDQLVVYTTRPLNPQPESLAFQVNVRNDVSGIGLDLRDDSRAWGSAGVLASVVYMDAVAPYADVDGFELLGHEVGHRWLSHLRFRDEDGATSEALLGRGAVHWSFFLDTAASVLEGNAIDEPGPGLFETTGIVSGYSALDLYAMGLMSAAEVPPFFHVAEAGDFLPRRTFSAASGPEVGVRFTGRRRDVTIGDVVAAEGPRVPDADHAPRRLRQAFVLVADAEAPASAARLAIVSRIRSRFGAWFAAATRGRGVADSTLP